jgi:hypothetical protein
MRGWFDLVSAASAETNLPTCRAFSKKRLMGFEPTTFCMAIRQSPRPLGSEYAPFTGVFVAERQTGRATNARGYASICSHSGTRTRECPKFEVAVSFLHAGPAVTYGRSKIACVPTRRQMMCGWPA